MNCENLNHKLVLFILEECLEPRGVYQETLEDSVFEEFGDVDLVSALSCLENWGHIEAISGDEEGDFFYKTTPSGEQFLEQQ